MKSLLFPIFVLSLLSTPGLAAGQPVSAQEQARIERILRRTPVIDGHNDLPWEIREKHGNSLENVDLASDTRTLDPPLHTDIPRLRQGGVGGQFWSVYVPASLRGLDSAQAVREQIALTRAMIQRYPQAFEIAGSAADIVRIRRDGRIASMFGMEGGEAINSDLALLREFRAAGVLYMTLCHSKTTDWVDSATDAPRHGGLSPFGEDVVREMNRIGMFVDLSHVSAEAMRDALRVTRAPVIFSHSSAFAIVSHPRNVPDDVLRMMRRNGGVVMVNFYPAFVSEAYRQWDATRDGEEARVKALNPGDPSAVTAAMAAWDGAHPAPRVTVSDVADHVEHIRDVAGVSHVGIGSDFDGVPSLPVGLEGVQDYPNLLAELMRRGWSDSDIAALAGGNLLRAMRQMERVAAHS